MDSNVHKADVYINGEHVGKTPFSGQIKKGKNLLLEVRKEGYETAFLRLNTSIEAIFFGNIIFGGFVGSTTDFATGNMWKISDNVYNVDLKKSSL